VLSTGTFFAVVSNSVLAEVATSAVVPLTDSNKAETPATKGAAMEVPDSIA